MIDDSALICWSAGLFLIGLTIAIHAIGLTGITVLLEREMRRSVGRHPARMTIMLLVIWIIAITGAALAMLHALEAGVWAIAYQLFDAFGSFSEAVLYSVDSMTTRGASGLTLGEQWRLMGALEAADGMLLFGISTAFLFAVLQNVWPMLTGRATPSYHSTAALPERTEAHPSPKRHG